MNWFSAAIVLMFLGSPSFAQHLKLQGKLIEDGVKHQTGTRISVNGSYSGVTDANGWFSIELSNNMKEGEKVIINVERLNVVINYPLDGEWNLPRREFQNVHTLDITIEPFGSKALWTHARIEKEMKKLSGQIAKLQKDASQPNEIDFTEYLEELAKKYGSTPKEAKEAFDIWANAVKGSADHHIKGLRDFYNKNFTAAAENFKKAAQKDEENAVENWKLAGDSELIAYEFREAVKSYSRAMNLISRTEHPEKWADIANRIGIAREELGTRVEGEEGLRILLEAIEAFRQALLVYTREQYPEDWAMVQLNLGTALSDQWGRTEGKEIVRLLGEAVEAHKNALKVYTREYLPQSWAKTQTNLGVALQEQGERMEGEQAVKLLGEAIEAYRNALKVIHLPNDRSLIQNNLGVALQSQGERTEGDEGKRLLGEAVIVLKDAIEIRTREHLPQERANSQTNLGNALSAQGKSTKGDEGNRLLSEAVAAYKNALEVRTREHLPQGWAETQTNLGVALQEQGKRTEGDEGNRLLGEAIAAYKNALQVHTREHFPQNWATAQNNLGDALSDLGEGTEGDEGRRLFSDAANAFRQTLLVFTREKSPQDWAQTQTKIGFAFRKQGERTKGDESRRLFGEAAAAYRQSLLVFTCDHQPHLWATAQVNLAQTLINLKDWANAAQCYIDVLQVYPDSQQAYQGASFIYHEVLFNFQLAFELDRAWLDRHPDEPSTLSDFAEKHFTTGRFDQCQQHILSLLTNDKLGAGTRIALRIIEIANLLALNKSSEVPSRINALIEAIGGQPADFQLTWSFEGTKHFLSGNERFAANRNWLEQLFVAIKGENRDVIVARLKAVSAKFISLK